MVMMPMMMNPNQFMQGAAAGNMDQAKMIKDISEALQSNFKDEISKLKDQMSE